MPLLTRRTVLAGLSAFAAAPARAENAWPSRQLALLVGFPPGGPLDTLARILADPLAKALGQPLVIESKPGATGNLAASLVVRARPDGYTLLALPGTYGAASAMFQTLPFNPTEDFTFISTTAENPLVIVTHPDTGIANLAELLRIARGRGTPLQYGTAGVGSVMHLTMELFAQKAGIRLEHIPYKGGMPAITALLGKQIDLVIDPPTALTQFVQDGKLRALAVTTGERFFGLADVPTMVEAGFPGFVVSTRQGIVGPAHLPEAVVAKLNRAVAAALGDPLVLENLRKIGSTPRLSTPQEYKTYVAGEIARWRQVIDEAHVARI